jgi:transcriptional regulator with XRE-family HTH domain
MMCARDRDVETVSRYRSARVDLCRVGGRAMAGESGERMLGERMRALRIDRGLSQRELARVANVSVGAVQHLESGAGATVRTLMRALDALEAEGWLASLEVPAVAFSPLAAAREERASRRAATRVPRVRRGQARPVAQ